ncbi:RluA family pseudouridine synthase [Robertmurraya siralis]|uniref:RluA family pseudouridine synthase n=1 Tax=Robertmurraya siralis TaxID=77777 RepID=UPI0010F96C57|nr:RluA family pseudouridine synthase [Robertmurraya siralis]
MIASSKKGQWFELIAPMEWQGITSEQLFSKVWQAPKKLTHLLKMNKEVMINGKPVVWTNPLKMGDRLQIKLFSDVDFGLIPQYMNVNIVYEDEHLLIAEKPPGTNTHPNEPGQTNTLANGIAYHLQAKGEFRQVKHIHRLDRDTSGVILFAKHAFIGALLDKMLEERQIKRSYSALVCGKILNKKGTIDAPIGRDRHHPTKRRVSPKGQRAVTHYEVVNVKKNATLIRCSLDTGRTHQIRVHLSHIGHPIVGDKLYGNSPKETRLHLHAVELKFVHPLTFEQIQVTSPIDWD